MFAKLNIRTQMLLLVGSSIGLFVIAICLALSAMTSGEQRMNVFIEKDTARLIAFHEMHAQGLQSGQALRNIILDPANPKAYDNLKKAIGDFDKAFAKARELTSDAEGLAALDEIGELVHKQSDARGVVLKSIAEENGEETMQQLNKAETPAWRALKQALLGSIERIGKQTEATKAQNAADNSAGRMRTLGFSLVAILASLLIAVFIVRNLIRQLGGEPADAVALAYRIAAGDLSTKTNLRSGDRTSMMAAMKEMTHHILTMIEDAHVLNQAALEGRLTMRADAKRHPGEFGKMIDGVNRTLDHLVGFLDHMPLPAMIIDRSFNVLYMNKAGLAIGSTTNDRLAGSQCAKYFKTNDCGTEKCACRRAMSDIKISNSTTIANPTSALALDIDYTAIPITDKDDKVVGAFAIVLDQTAVRKAQRLATKVSDYQTTEVRKLQGALIQLASGDTNISRDIPPPDEDTAEAAKAFLTIREAIDNVALVIRNLAQDANMLVEAAAAGVLATRADPGKHDGDFQRIILGVNETLDLVIR